jgi:hypothetical protein
VSLNIEYKERERRSIHRLRVNNGRARHTCLRSRRWRKFAWYSTLSEQRRRSNEQSDAARRFKRAFDHERIKAWVKEVVEGGKVTRAVGVARDKERREVVR